MDRGPDKDHPPLIVEARPSNITRANACEAE